MTEAYVLRHAGRLKRGIRGFALVSILSGACSAFPGCGRSSRSGDGAPLSGNAGEPGYGASGAGGGVNACHDLCTGDTPACCEPDLGCVENVPRCRIDVLATSLGAIASDAELDYAELEATVAALSGDVLHTISDLDVASAGADPPNAARFVLHLKPEVAPVVADKLAGKAEAYPFRVSCDERALFLGVLYNLWGSAEIRAPVLHVAVSGHDVALQLGAWQGAWTGFGPDPDESLRELLDRPELRATFCARGTLSELPPP